MHQSKLPQFLLPPRAPSPYNHANSAKTVPMKYIHYQPARLVKGKRMYVEFRYRREDGTWQRFRVFQNINRFKSDQYANDLVDAINRALEAGLNPFNTNPETIEVGIKPTDQSLNQDLTMFLEYCQHKGLRKKTISAYKITVNLLREYFLKDNKIYLPAEKFTMEDMEGFLNENARQKNWSNRTYNNYLSDTSTIFKFLVKKKRIVSNPLEDIEPKQTVATKNKYYDDNTLASLKAMMQEKNPYLLKFFSTIYYTAVRPKSELRFLKCKHVLFDRKLLFVPGQISKNKKDDYIPLCDEMLDIFREMGVETADPEFYIFSTEGKPAPKHASANHFANKFSPFKKALKLGPEYTLYGAKHSRAIHLAQDGANPYDLMRLFRHSSLEITMNYLRDLGLEDHSEILSKGRKF